MYTESADTGSIDRLFSMIKALDRLQQQTIEALSPRRSDAMWMACVGAHIVLQQRSQAL